MEDTTINNILSSLEYSKPIDLLIASALMRKYNPDQADASGNKQWEQLFTSAVNSPDFDKDIEALEERMAKTYNGPSTTSTNTPIEENEMTMTSEFMDDVYKTIHSFDEANDDKYEKKLDKVTSKFTKMNYGKKIKASKKDNKAFDKSFKYVMNSIKNAKPE